jgi:putative flippase GtrA
VPALTVQFLAFCLVGVVGALAHYGTLILLVEALRLDPVAASAFGFVAGGLTNYALNRRYTFRATTAHVRAMPRFFAVAGAGLGLNIALMALLVKVMGLHYLPSQIATTAMLTLWHFGANRFWTFR